MTTNPNLKIVCFPTLDQVGLILALLEKVGVKQVEYHLIEETETPTEQHRDYVEEAMKKKPLKHHGTATEAVLNALLEHHPNSMHRRTLMHVIQRFGKNPNSISGIISRLSARRLVQKTSNGEYKAIKS